jgi:hypothetical protein
LGRADGIQEGYGAVPEAGDKTWHTNHTTNQQHGTDSAESARGMVTIQATQTSAPPVAPRPAGIDRRPPTGDDLDAARARIRADRAAKEDVVRPLAWLLRDAETMRQNLNDPDSGEDPEDLFTKLVDKVREVAARAGLGPVAEPGTETTYDPERHWAMGIEPPPPGTRVMVVPYDPGQQWSHGGEHLVIAPARVALTDDQRGAYAVHQVSSLDEEATQEIWLDVDSRYRPPHYAEPGWYTVEAVEDCDGSIEVTDDGGHPAGTACDGLILWFTDADNAYPVHYPRHARVALSYND